MPASYPLTLPSTPGIRDIEWLPTNNVETSRSIFTFVSQTYDWGGKTRSVRIELPPMSVANAKVWQAWLHEMNGRAGTFYVKDSIGDVPQGTGGGTPLVKGAGQTSESLATDGWTPTTATVKAGDWISIHDRLYMILDDVTADGSGNMTLTVWPNADDPGDNATIAFGTAAKGIFRLSDFPSFAWSVDRIQEPLTLIAVEAKVWGALLEQNGDALLLEDSTYLTIEG